MLAKAERTERLAREIQNAKMQLAQIRARHPEPRLTLDQASEFCDDQMDQYISQSEKKDELAAQATIAKERADKEETRTRALREELMKREREVEKNKARMQSSGGPTLPDRYSLFYAIGECACSTNLLQAWDLRRISQDEYLDSCRAPRNRQRSAPPPQSSGVSNARDPLGRVRPYQIYACGRSGE